MTKILRSAAFKRQALAFTADYKQRVSPQVAGLFIDDLEQAIVFIAANPKACRVYTQLAGYEFRKWTFSRFPHAIYFRLEQDAIVLECLYAHKMDADVRLQDDLGLND